LDIGLEYYNTKKGIELHHNISAIGEIITTYAKKYGVLALQDYYDWWSQNNEEFSTGKLLPLDLNNKEVHHVFFDDNIHLDQFHSSEQQLIVDVRNSVTGAFISPLDCVNVHLVKVEPFHVILNQNYFIEELERCEINFNNKVKLKSISLE